MTVQNYFDSYQGQSLLYAPSAAREFLRGQCVQAVCFYVNANGAPVLWVDGAADWWDAAAKYPNVFERIPNTPSAVPEPGDIIIWGRNLPGSGDATHDPAKGQGYGHIDVCLRPLPGTGTFIGVDQNWGGKTVHQVTHNYNYVIGWLRIKSAAVGGMGGGGAAITQGEEMITDSDNEYWRWAKIGQEIRGRTLSRDEFRAAAVGKNWLNAIEILSDNAEADRTQQLQTLGQVAASEKWQDKMSGMQSTINDQNATISELNAKLSDTTASNSEKQTALNDALAKLGAQNADLTTLHDQLADLQAKAESGEEISASSSDKTPKISLVPVFKALLSFAQKIKKQ